MCRLLGFKCNAINELVTLIVTILVVYLISTCPYACLSVTVVSDVYSVCDHFVLILRNSISPQGILCTVVNLIIGLLESESQKTDLEAFESICFVLHPRPLSLTVCANRPRSSTTSLTPQSLSIIPQ